VQSKGDSFNWEEMSDGRWRVWVGTLNTLQAARHIVAAMRNDLDRLEAPLLKRTRKVGR
jgi:hypothetical protein